MDRRARMLWAYRLRERVSRGVGFDLLHFRADDRLVVAFPRSGSTWLRAVLTNVLLPWARSNPDVFNALIPGVTIRGALAARSLARPRLLSSHCEARPELPRVLYCVRDGRDVIVSLYHYLVTRRGYSQLVSFERFFEEHLAGEHGTPWHVSVAGWLRAAPQMGERIQIVRYEDLLGRPLEELAPVLRFLGVDADPLTMQRALAEASLASMRRIEAERLGASPAADSSFYRRGKPRQWREWITPALDRRFIAVAGEALELGGYLGGEPTWLNVCSSRGNECAR